MLKEQLQKIIDQKTKPPGALGQLEAVALQIGMIQNTTKPFIRAPHIIVFAGDHGIAKTGLVNPYPQAVTAQMVKNFLAGGAAINVFCRQQAIALKIVDAGTNHTWNDRERRMPNFLVRKTGWGTANYLEGAAMTAEQCREAVENGHDVIKELKNTGCNTVGFGEMGIGNTSSASLIMSSILGCSVADCVGRGTGASDDQLQIKKEALQKAATLHGIHNLRTQPLELLRTIGGFEIAMMAGAYLQAAAQGMIILVDGFIATAALLIAQQWRKDITKNCLFAHNSGEQGHKRMLDYLGATPLLHLGLRLGEGTGAALALPLVQAAVNFLNEMASFETAGVAGKA